MNEEELIKIIKKIKVAEKEEIKSFENIKPIIVKALEKNKESALKIRQYNLELKEYLDKNGISENSIEFRIIYNGVEDNIDCKITKEEYIKLIKQVDSLNRIARG
jgi:hypothetical protein